MNNKTFRILVFRALRPLWLSWIALKTARWYFRRSLSYKAVVGAVYSLFLIKKSPQERLWIEKIEAIRNQLLSSTEAVTDIDYGAGSADLELTTENTEEGRRAQKSISDICRASKSTEWALFLYKLVRLMKPTTCLELGTALGISASYQSVGLYFNGKGRLVTLEGSPSRAAIANSNLNKLGTGNTQVIVGRFQDTLEQVLQNHDPVDFVFLDGHHSELATVAYFELIVHYLSSESILIVDDIIWSEGMRRAWSRIVSDQRTQICFNLGDIGVCIFSEAIDSKAVINLTKETLFVNGS